MTAAELSATDRGLTLGDGLFETVLWEGGRLHRLAAHLARLAAGCAVLGLPAPDPARAEAALRDAVAAAGLDGGRAAARLTWTAGPGGRGLDRPEALGPALFATAAPAPRPATPVRLATSAIRRNAGSPASRLKTLSYLDNVLARAEARSAGADEALMLNAAGEAACAAAANLFWIDATGRLVTPALDCGALAGVTRAAVLAAAPRLSLAVVEARAGPEELAAARHVFLSNSLIGLRPVSALDGRELPAWPGLGALEAALA